MALLNKDEILSINDAAFKEVEVPEWGGSVMIKTMTAGEKGKFEQKMLGKTVDYSTVLAEYASLIICDEDGKRLFTAADIKKLADKSASSLQKVFDAGQSMNAMNQDDIEELAGN